MNCILQARALDAVCSAEKKSLSITRIDLLKDNTFRILKTGKLAREPLRKPFINYTAFILRTLAEESYTEPTFFADNGWNEFQKAAAVRHRLTHPKRNSDVDVTDDELKSVEEAFRWYFGAMGIAMGNKSFWTGPKLADLEPPRFRDG
jgi:hypothetical protein